MLDHPLLSRLGNLETLLKWTAVGLLGLVGAAVALFELVTHAGVVADILFALALLVAVGLIARQLMARRSATRLQPDLGTLRTEWKLATDRLSGSLRAHRLFPPSPPWPPPPNLEPSASAEAEMHDEYHRELRAGLLAALENTPDRFLSDRDDLRHRFQRAGTPDEMWQLVEEASAVREALEQPADQHSHIEIGERRSRVVVQPLSFDPERQRSDPDPLQRGLRQMDATIRQQWHELKGERTARETIPPEHRQELRGFLTGAIKALEGEQQYHYDEVSSITQANRAVFATHFPKAAERLDAWNQALFARDAPVGLLSNRIVREAQARGFNEPGAYWQNEVARLVKDVTFERLRKGIPAPQVGSLVEWEQRVDGFGPTLHAKGHRIATAQHDSDNVLQGKREAVERWLAEVQSWPEVDAYSEAERRFALNTDRHDLLAELRKFAKIEHLPNAGECEICRGNRGDFD
ncbi:MAG TPA: hypothetical protein VLJ80_00565 [Solirubrobacteraceae bacterium]|nr:hypothetical protein [Solirubrobacteraceae bacterium]